MDRYALLGNPVAHSKSPWIHARYAQLTGQSLSYERILVPVDGFAGAVRDFREAGGKGCNVTVPFKFEAAPLATRLTPRAELAGACNTLRFEGGELLADNTDGIGLVSDIERNAKLAIKGRYVLIVGAGGAAAGLLGPLIEAGARSITVANRTQAKAQLLIDRHAALAQQHGVRLEAPELALCGEGFDIVINATASSMTGGAVPVPERALRTGTLACDLMYGPAAQGFLDWAHERGAVPRDGLGMLVEQAAEAFEVWRGVRPPSAQVLAELREALAQGKA